MAPQIQRAGRAFAIACIGWGSLTGAALAPANHHNVKGSATESIGANESYRPFPNPNSASCYRANDHDAADLCAQWRAAIASERAVEVAQVNNYVALAGAILSSLSIVLLIATIAQARRTNRIAAREYGAARLEAKRAAEGAGDALLLAQRNADAAERQVEAARDATKQQLRAYISVQLVEIEEIKPTGSPLLLKMTFINTGPTPANDWVVRWAWQIRPQQPTVPSFDQYLAIHGAIEQSFGPNQTKTPHNRLNVSDPDRIAIQAGTMGFYILGETTYTDIFGDIHKTTFFYGYNPELSNRMGQVPQHNRIR